MSKEAEQLRAKVWRLEREVEKLKAVIKKGRKRWLDGYVAALLDNPE